MTRDQLELILAREGLTRPQTAAVLDAADKYATSQAKAAIRSVTLGYTRPLVHYLPGAKIGVTVACGATNQDLVNTRLTHRVTCEACKQTDAWKKAA